MPEQEPKDSPNQERYFRTDHLIKGLGRRTARGGAVAITGQALKFFITIGATSAMARLLTPQDYGLITMVAFVTGFVSMYKDLGLAAATIQRPEITSDQISTLFWINIALSLAIALFTTAIAPLVSWFYGEPRLTAITIITAAGFIVSGLAVQHEALLRRQMRYFALSAIGLSSMILGYVVGIYLAWKGLNYWALVGSQLAVISSTTAITWTVCGWRPGLPKKDTGVRSMIRFGGNLTGFTTINFFSRNLDNLLIGRVWGAPQLGIYSRAYQLMTLPIEQINEPITSVAVPSLSRLTDAPEDYRKAYLRMLQKIALLTMPCMAVMIASSDWIIRVVLGPKWSDTTQIFLLLGITGLFQPIANTTGWLFITQGRSRQIFQWGLISGPITIVSIVAGLPWKALGVAAAYVLTQICVTYPLLFWFVGRSGPVRTMDFYRTIAPVALASLSGLGVALALRRLLEIHNPLFGMAACAVVIFATTLIVLGAMPAGRMALRDIKKTALMMLNREALLGS